MRITDMNWMQVEEYLKHDDRAVVPLGSTEQHGYLSLSVDSLLAERVAIDAAEPLGVPVFPVVAYGVTPYFGAFPGTVTPPHGNLHPADPRYPGQPGQQRLPAHFCSSTAMAATVQPMRWPPNGWRIIPAHGSSSTTGGTRPRPGPRCWRSTRWAAMLRGWRTFRGRAWPMWNCPPNRSLSRRVQARPGWWGPRCAPSTATATTAATTSGPTTKCLRSGHVAIAETRSLITEGWD